MVWNSDFLNDPKSGDYGSVSCYAINQLLLLFKQMLSIEHTWDNAVSPVLIHRVGECSVLNILEDIPISNGFKGAMQFNKTDKTLYWDSSAVMVGPINSLDHSTLLEKGDDDHTQYLLLAGRLGTAPKYSEITDIDLLNGSIENLSVVSGSYTQDYHIVPKGIHIGNDLTTGSLHDDNCITIAPIDVGIPVTKFDTSTVVVIDSDVGAFGGRAFCDFAGDFFCPWMDGTTAVFLAMRPHRVASIAGVTNWNGGFDVQNNTISLGHITLTAKKVTA